ncbi:hypothetical protein PMI04_018050 [Sphingobium sp. AP49]|uniref:hypothetical protein n=1 Tax=Sphingobium sp. AP49 TaxID=1144307 RepID=UPI00026ECCC6|nr:hypothetical protein [Sphingobium sp. AP49]WHO38427.1 hypothetical protein PMI04_018050 [Sphingobium sp. AP49]
MNWTRIRLELARTDDFPRGSAARSYVLRLPLKADGLIDEQEYRRHPELATVGRFWSNEPDRHGCLLHRREGWIFAYRPDGQNSERIAHLTQDVIRAGRFLTLTGSDGTQFPLLIKSLAPA